MIFHDVKMKRMNFLSFVILTWLLFELLLCDRVEVKETPNFEDKLGIGEHNERSSNVDSDLVLNSTDIINGSDVIDIVTRIETISSRILATTQRRRQRLLTDQDQEVNVSETPEFQLIFLSKDNKVVNDKILSPTKILSCFRFSTIQFLVKTLTQVVTTL